MPEAVAQIVKKVVVAPVLEAVEQTALKIVEKLAQEDARKAVKLAAELNVMAVVLKPVL